MRIIDQHDQGLLKDFCEYLITTGLNYTEIMDGFHEFLALNQTTDIDDIIKSINEETRRINEIDKKLKGE